MRRNVKLNFGERMREWRKARREYVEKIKQKIKEKAEIDDTYPKLAPQVENKTISLSPTQVTESKQSLVKEIKQPNHIDMAVNLLREKIKGY